MSGNADADVNIHLKADDQATPVVQTATQQINSSYRQMTSQVNASGKEFLTNNSVLYASGRAMTAVGRVTDRAISLFNSYNLMQIRMQQAATATTDAQEKLSQAIAEFGPNSQQAIAAAEAVQKAQTDQAKASQQAQIQFALMVVSMVAQTGTMFTSVIPKLLGVINTLNALRTAAAVNAAVDVAAAGGVGAGTLAGAGAGATIGGIAAKLGTSALKVAPAAAGVGTAVELLSMMGSQQAGGGEDQGVPTGLDAIKQILGQASQTSVGRTITNYFTIISNDAQDVANQVAQKIGLINSAGGGTP